MCAVRNPRTTDVLADVHTSVEAGGCWEMRGYQASGHWSAARLDEAPLGLRWRDPTPTSPLGRPATTAGRGHPMTPMGDIRAPHGRSAPLSPCALLPASHSADEHVLGFDERVPGGKKKFTYGIIGRTRPPVRTRYAYTMASRQRRAVTGPTRRQRLSGPTRRIGRFVAGPPLELCGFCAARPKTMRERWRSSCSTWGYLQMGRN